MRNVTCRTVLCVAMWGLSWTVGLADEQQPRRRIHVTGQGTATAPPDMAVVQSGVVTQAGTASEALAANATGHVDVEGAWHRG
jgi:uncharacterized protein YggE